MLTIGIDPGLSGAIAVLGPDGSLVQVIDLPVMRDGKLSWIDGGRLQSFLIEAAAGREMTAIIERVHAMNTWAKGACFNFGTGFGSVLAILQARQIPIQFVQPATWKSALGLSRDKKASLHKARLLFPSAPLDRMKDEGRAESLLLAYYALNRRQAPA